MHKSTATYATSIFLFQRDLRLQDNLALTAALTASARVIPCFILDKLLLQKLHNDMPRVQYLLSALCELDKALQQHGSRLHVVHDDHVNGLQSLQKVIKAQAVYCHRDFSAYAIRRQHTLRDTCQKIGMEFFTVDDLTLHPPEQTLKADGTPYTIFTPFFRRASVLPASKPKRFDGGKLATLPNGNFSFAAALQAAGLTVTTTLSPASEVKQSLKNLIELQDYRNTRDIPAISGTARLSTLLRFGIISSREAWWEIAQTLGNEHPLLRQLYWRDFFFSIGLYFPRVFSGCFNQQYNRIVWPDKTEWITAWKTSRTGFPIVDAGLRELKETGYMHNRVRMIVASFLVKDLHCNWQIGEKHFAEELMDYDPCINNGNWQWAASTGCDAQPYFRIFNPWTQQQKFDADCVYIKRWLPELANVPAKTLHNLFKLDKALPGYMMPIVDHSTQSQIAKRLFEEVKTSSSKLSF